MLVNTAIASAADPIAIATMPLNSCEAGALARQARLATCQQAVASSPLSAFLESL
ncbi:hypothetical protein [Alishewanella longhuensis]